MGSRQRKENGEKLKHHCVCDANWTQQRLFVYCCELKHLRIPNTKALKLPLSDKTYVSPGFYFVFDNLKILSICTFLHFLN